MMRYGAIFSGLLHVGILILIIVGLPGLLQSERVEMTPIAVEVVSIEELSKQQEKKTPPKPKAKKPPPKKPDPPKTTKKPPPPPPAPPTPEPKPEPKPPEVEPEPAPKPKPKPKADPVPKPKAKPAPPKKPETQVAAKTPPKPKRKPKPPPPKPPKPDEFQSLLKNLAKDRRAAEKAKVDAPTKVAKQAVEEPKRSALQARMMAASLAQAINQQVTPCWSIPAGAKDAANMSVAIRIRLNPDGALGAAPRVEDTGRIGRDPFFRAVAESALRALRNPGCMPLKLPYDQYDLWKEIIFTFDPKEALGQ